MLTHSRQQELSGEGTELTSVSKSTSVASLPYTKDSFFTKNSECDFHTSRKGSYAEGRVGWPGGQEWCPRGPPCPQQKQQAVSMQAQRERLWAHNSNTHVPTPRNWSRENTEGGSMMRENAPSWKFGPALTRPLSGQHSGREKTSSGASPGNVTSPRQSADPKASGGKRSRSFTRESK